MSNRFTLTYASQITLWYFYPMLRVESVFLWHPKALLQGTIHNTVLNEQHFLIIFGTRNIFAFWLQYNDWYNTFTLRNRVWPLSRFSTNCAVLANESESGVALQLHDVVREVFGLHRIVPIVQLMQLRTFYPYTTKIYIIKGFINLPIFFLKIKWAICSKCVITM